MNIAFLSSAFLREKKESTTITLLALANELKRRGHTVVIITEKKKNYPAAELLDGVPIYRPFSGTGIGRILAHVRGVAAVQKKLGLTFDVIHGFSAAPVLGLRTRLARSLYAKSAVAVHTLKSISKYAQGFARFLNGVDAVTVPTFVMHKQLTSSGVFVEKVRVVRSFIDLKKYVPSDKNELKKKYNLVGKWIILYYGSLFEKKGVMYLFRALRAVVKHIPHTLLLLAPRHPLPIEYTQMIKDMEIEDYVHVLTQNISLPDYVNLANVVVLPYVNLVGTEGNPSCLLESVACKTPVVTTNQPELQEIFGDSEIFYARPADTASLAGRICFAYDHPETAAAHAAKAVLKIAQFDIQKVADEFEEIYKKFQSKI